MLFLTWTTGELRREYTYYEGKPCMEITRPLDRSARGFRIMLDAAFKYAEPKDEDEIRQVLKATLNGAGMLNIPKEAQSLARLVGYIQDGLDELIGMKPGHKDVKVVGEGTASFDGNRPFTFEVI